MFIAWIEGFAIFLGVFIVAGVGSWNDWQKEKQFLKLQAESDKDNTVSGSIFSPIVALNTEFSLTNIFTYILRNMISFLGII